jgi:hypothetical protein
LAGEKLKVLLPSLERGCCRSDNKLSKYRSHVCRNPLCKKKRVAPKKTS